MKQPYDAIIEVNSVDQTHALVEVLKERVAQDAAWRCRGNRTEGQYVYAAPHILVLEEQMAKLRANWYGSADESSLRERLVKIAAIALRALEEIKITR